MDLRLVILDDDPFVRKIVVRVAKHQRWDVRDAATEADARVLIDDWRGTPGPPIVVLLDWYLNGSPHPVKLATELRVAGVAFLWHTASPWAVPRGDPSIQKPVSLEDLVQVIERASGMSTVTPA